MGVCSGKHANACDNTLGDKHKHSSQDVVLKKTHHQKPKVTAANIINKKKKSNVTDLDDINIFYDH